MSWTSRERILAVIGVSVHLILGWYVYDAHKKTPRIIQVINCEGETEFEGQLREQPLPATEEKKERPAPLRI